METLFSGMAKEFKVTWPKEENWEEPTLRQKLEMCVELAPRLVTQIFFTEVINDRDDLIMEIEELKRRLKTTREDGDYWRDGFYAKKREADALGEEVDKLRNIDHGLF